jgi:hypothetical protein
MKLWLAEVLRQTSVPISTSPCGVSPSQPNSVCAVAVSLFAMLWLRLKAVRSLQPQNSPYPGPKSEPPSQTPLPTAL